MCGRVYVFVWVGKCVCSTMVGSDGCARYLFQEHLEKNTEHLAELTEMPLTKVDRTDLVNYTRVTQKVCIVPALFC